MNDDVIVATDIVIADLLTQAGAAITGWPR